MKRITVNASRRYDIIIENGILKNAGEYIRSVTSAQKAFIVSDDIVFGLYGKTLERSLASRGFQTCSFVFKNGEQSKTLETYTELMESLHDFGMTRSDVITALGGGVVGDMAGFAAATYQRGISYIQIPTTLLAAVDSSVGGKTGVDLKHGKNQVGCFYQPSLVLCDPDTLDSLPKAQYRSGCAEIIKYAMIGSEKLFDDITQNEIRDIYTNVIAECVDMKRKIVEQDEFDTGTRMLLNFGHTLGHAVESCSGYTVLHGQAVAIGMAAITKKAVSLGYCKSETYARLLSALDKYSLPKDIQYKADEILGAVMTDKKSSGSFINLIVPLKVGECVIKKIPKDRLTEWID